MNDAKDLTATLTEHEFMSHYWQRQPVVLKGAFPEAIGTVDGDDLAGLAAEEVVESRIITGAGLNGPWRCRNGPFIDFDYSVLGRKNWSLLVQGVDQWIDEVRSLLGRFDFLPAWRLEDIMVSFAPTGGGVGPHFDYYDVFLIQASGERRWELGPRCDDATPLQDNAGVRLLREFSGESHHDLVPGDGLYVPAGTAHWGTSLSEDCVTLSIGFRAPSDKDILSEAVDLLASELTDAVRYRDTDASIDDDPYRINAAAMSYAESVLERLDKEKFTRALSEAFGRLVTDTRHCSYREEDPGWAVEALAARFSNRGTIFITHRVHCRMAYSDEHLFVNGSAYRVDTTFARDLCHGYVESPPGVRELDVLVALLREDMIALDQAQVQN